jgi:hypothetical protein
MVCRRLTSGSFTHRNDHSGYWYEAELRQRLGPSIVPVR